MTWLAVAFVALWITWVIVLRRNAKRDRADEILSEFVVRPRPEHQHSHPVTTFGEFSEFVEFGDCSCGQTYDETEEQS